MKKNKQIDWSQLASQYNRDPQALQAQFEAQGNRCYSCRDASPPASCSLAYNQIILICTKCTRLESEFLHNIEQLENEENSHESYFEKQINKLQGL